MSKKYRTMARKVNGKVRKVREDSILMEISVPVAEIIVIFIDGIERQGHRKNVRISSISAIL